jgi:probable F420-dependent oxidoreductase
MKIGVVFPQSEIGNDPEVIAEYVQTAERLGYDHLRVYDHVLGAVPEGREPPLMGPYTEATPFHEPFVLFGYLAAITERIELVAGVIVLPQRQTALVAKQAAQVDILSGGRLRLGVGVGWNYVEYEALNEDFSNRGKREEEQIEVMRRLWDEPTVDFTGKYHRIDRAGILPRPTRRIPIWLGGASDIAYERAARLADGFLFSRPRDMVADGIAKIRSYGCAPTFGIDALVGYPGGPDRWRKDAEAYEQLGATHITVSMMGEGFSPQDHIAALAGYIEALPSRP